MRGRLASLVAVLAVVAVSLVTDPGSAFAQVPDTETPAARDQDPATEPAAQAEVEEEAPSDEELIRGVVHALFDAMRDGDGAAAATLFHPDAQLYSIGEQDGQPILRMDPAGGFVQAIGTPRTQVWDERISNIEVRLDGRFATAWMNYAFYIDDTFSHCGVNAFQLFRGSAGWQIIQITDTRREVDCGEID